jgi:hypothetical protein
VQFRWEKNRNSSLTTPFNSSDDNTYRTIQGAFWVTEGADRCIVGRLAPELKEQQGNLEGRIAQVIEIFQDLHQHPKLPIPTSMEVFVSPC